MPSTPPPWQPTVRLIADGEPVSAEIANRPLKDLVARTSYLKAVLDYASIGQAIADANAPLADNTFVGAAVYRAADGTYKLALAALAEDTSLGYFDLAESARVVGIVSAKQSATLGVVTFFGRLTDLELTDAIAGGDAPEYGQYYLSSQEPGKLVRQQPAVGVPVCIIFPSITETTDEVFVNPTPRDVIEDHVHIRVPLYTDPAGYTSTLVNNVNQANQIYLPDVNGLGWLPANHAIFDGRAPANAKFGYNLSTHAALAAVWPLIPVESCYIELDGVGQPLGYNENSEGALIVVDRYGIWWMDSCYGSCPWQDPQLVRYNPNTGGLEYAATYNQQVYDTYYGSCSFGVDRDRQLVLWGTRMVAKTDATMVTSLESGSDSIRVENCEGEPAKAGCLSVSLDLQLDESEDEDSYTVVKDVAGEQKIVGPIVASLKSSDGTISIVGSETLENGRIVGHLDLSTDAGADGRELEVFLAALDQATQEMYQDVPFFGFPTSIESSIRFKVVVPHGLSGAIKYRLWVLGTTAAALPDLEFTCRRLPRPANQSTEFESLPISDNSATPISLATIATAYDYIERDTSPGFEVEGGDVVLMTLRRNASDGYAGMIGLLKISPLLTSAT